MKTCTYPVIILFILFTSSCCTPKSGTEVPKATDNESTEVKSKAPNAKSLLMDGKWKSIHKGGGDFMVVREGVVFYTQKWDVDPPDEFPVVRIIPRFEENAIHLDFEKFTYTLVPVSFNGETRFVINPRDVKNIPEHRLEKAFRYVGKSR